jgi:hypothetical protein
MSKINETEKPGFISESETAYGKIWNEPGQVRATVSSYWTEPDSTWYQPKGSHLTVRSIRITNEMIEMIQTGEFDGCTTVANIIWSWGPCTKFNEWLKSNGHWNSIHARMGDF